MPRFSSRLALGVSFFVTFALAAPKRASAEGPTRPLHEAIAVEPGATCLDATMLVEHVEMWLETANVDAELSVIVRGSPDQPRTVTFQTLRAGRVIASRRFAPGPERCDHLHAALGLAIAMAIKASLVEEIAGPPPSPPPHPPAAAPAPVTFPSPLDHPAGNPPPESRAWAVGADGLAALAALPDAAFGFDARIERALGATFGVRAGVLALLSLGEQFQGGPGRFDAWLLAPRVDLCAAVDASQRVRLRGCMGAAVGAIHARGYDLPTPQSSFVRWFAVANGLDLSAAVTKNWSFDAGVTLFLPVARNSIVVRDPSGRVVEERDLASVGGYLSVGPVYRF